MKKQFLSAAFFLWAIVLLAQSPAAFKYSAVALDAGGQPVTGDISVKFTIHEDGETGAIRYQEIHQNFGVNNGKFNLEVGQGTPSALSGLFADIDWANHRYWLRVQLALNGSSSFNNFGVSQLLSVPYALYAAQAGGNANDKDEQTISVNGNQISISNGNSQTLPIYQAGNGISIAPGNQIVNTAPDQPITLTGGGSTTVSGSYPNFAVTSSSTNYTAGQGIQITAGNVINNSGDLSNINELQTISLANGILTLSNGGSVPLPLGTDAQILTVNGNQLSISNGNSVSLPPEVDGSVTNELQTISLANGVLTLSNGGSVSLPLGADAQILTVNGNQLSISNGNSVPLPPEVDGSVTNELQTISLANGVLTLSNGGTVTLPTPTAGPGISITNNLITNTAPDQPLSLTGSGNTTVTGTYPNFTISSMGGGSNVAPGTGIEMAVNGSTTTVSARNTESLWNAVALRGRPIGGMEPQNGSSTLIYNSSASQYEFMANGSDLAGNNAGVFTVTALRGRPIGGMEPQNGSSTAMIYNSTTNQYEFMQPGSDLAGDQDGNLTIARLQGLNVNLAAGFGPDQALTCVNNGNGGLEFQCKPVNGAGFQLPYQNLSANNSQTLFNIRNLNAGAAIGMQVRNTGRYGIKGIADEGQANFSFSDLTTAFTYPAGLFGEHTNPNQAGLGVLGKAVSSSDPNEGIGGMFMGKSAGVFGVCYSGGLAAVVGYGAATGVRAGYFVGNVDIVGGISKSSGSFKIDHPQDPENKFLYHSFVESPDMKNIYDGVITTDVNGYATVELPAYFEALNKDFRYQLTCIGDFAQAIVAKKVEHNQFIIRTDKPNMEVSWQVTGIRQDPWAEQHRIVPEVEKAASEKGDYLHPELYGQPLSRQIGQKIEK